MAIAEPSSFPSGRDEAGPWRQASTSEPRPQRPPLSHSLSTPAGDLSTPQPRMNLRRRARPPLLRGTSIREAISNSACNYLGIPTASGGASPADGSAMDPASPAESSKWTSRRLRHCSRRYGGVKPDARLMGASGTLPSTPMTAGFAPFSEEPSPGGPSATAPLWDPLSLGRLQRATSFHRGQSVDVSAVLRSDSEHSRGSKVRVLQRRESVAKMAWEGLAALVSKGTLRGAGAPTARRRQRQTSHSFTPGSVGLDGVDSASSVFEASGMAGPSHTLPAPLTIPSAGEVGSLGPSTAGTLTYDSIPMATIDEAANEEVRLSVDSEEAETADLGGGDRARGASLTPPIEDVLQDLRLRRAKEPKEPRPDRPQVPSPSHSQGLAETPLENEVFFDLPPVPPHRHHHHHHHIHQPQPFFPPQPRVPTAAQKPSGHVHYARGPGDFPFPLPPAQRRALDSGRLREGTPRDPRDPVQPASAVGPPDRPDVPAELQAGVAPSEQQHWLRKRQREKRRPKAVSAAAARKKASTAHILDEGRDEGRSVWGKLFHSALDNGDRRRLGEGVMGRFFGRSLKKRSELEPHVRQQLDDFDDHRPYFTWWVTTVQCLVTIVSICLYGIGPIGFTRTQFTSLVLHSSVTLKQVPYYEQDNFWIGPRYADLVHLGAKYSPCMRRDEKLQARVAANRRRENSTSCCVYNDKTGCFQTSLCPKLIATSLQWTRDNPGPGGRVSGTVCGQDPRACRRPTSIAPFEWPDDITRWPICEEAVPDSPLRHMSCEITGRPCCIGIQGECRITTREYCDFVKGYFHEEATLCSQVHCMGEVCGMIPFLSAERPDQFYRLFVSLFLHAGLVHVAFSAVIQYFLMRDLEKLIGWSRMALIYLVSGVGGNLSSAIFVPYAAEVGPAGSQFAVLAALFVDALYSWRLIVAPHKALLQLLGVTALCFLIGALPWVDNWAHLFGFLFGLLLSLALFPYIQFDSGGRSQTKRVLIVVLSLGTAVAIFAGLIVLFYVFPFWDCKTKRVLIVVLSLGTAVAIFAGLIVLFYVFPFWDCKTKRVLIVVLSLGTAVAIFAGLIVLFYVFPFWDCKTKRVLIVVLSLGTAVAIFAGLIVLFYVFPFWDCKTKRVLIVVLSLGTAVAIFAGLIVLFYVFPFWDCKTKRVLIVVLSLGTAVAIFAGLIVLFYVFPFWDCKTKRVLIVVLSLGTAVAIFAGLIVLFYVFPFWDCKTKRVLIVVLSLGTAVAIFAGLIVLFYVFPFWDCKTKRVLIVVLSLGTAVAIFAGLIVLFYVFPFWDCKTKRVLIVVLSLGTAVAIFAGLIVLFYVFPFWDCKTKRVLIVVLSLGTAVAIFAGLIVLFYVFPFWDCKTKRVLIVVLSLGTAVAIFAGLIVLFYVFPFWDCKTKRVLIVVLSLGTAVAIFAGLIVLFYVFPFWDCKTKRVLIVVLSLGTAVAIFAGLIVLFYVFPFWDCKTKRVLIVVLSLGTAVAIFAGLIVLFYVFPFWDCKTKRVLIVVLSLGTAVAIFAGLIVLFYVFPFWDCKTKRVLIVVLSLGTAVAIFAGLIVLFYVFPFWDCKTKRVLIVVLSLGTAVAIFAGLIVLFYVFPFWDCKTKRVLIVVLSLGTAVAIFAGLIVLFYVFPFWDCKTKRVLIVVLSLGTTVAIFAGLIVLFYVFPFWDCKTKRVLIVVLSLGTAVAIFAGLIVLFYVFPFWDCKTKRVLIVVLSLGTAVAIFAGLIVLFYVFPFWDCKTKRVLIVVLSLGTTVAIFAGLIVLFYVFPFWDCKTKRVLIVVLSLGTAVAIFAGLIVLFYVFPFWDCKACGWFNCIPLASHFCDNTGLQLDLLPI